jgi:hypothetical protein
MGRKPVDAPAQRWGIFAKNSLLRRGLVDRMLSKSSSMTDMWGRKFFA